MTLDELADLEALRRTLATFCLRVDEYDLPALADVFTGDAHVDYGPGRGGPRDGRSAVVARIADGQSEFRRTHHQLGQSVIDLDGDEAHAVTYVTAWHEDWAGHVSEVRLRYVDDLRREERTWRIARRAVLASGAVGFDGTDWNYVPRTIPASRQD
jgi:ketosteroid isomerase-like protein